MDYFVDAIKAVLREERAGSAVIIGHSMGAIIALHFYRRYPTQTQGLVLVDGPPPTHTREFIEPLVNSLRVDYARTTRMVIDELLEPIQSVDLRNQIEAVMLNVPKYVSISELQSAMNQQQDVNSQINVPVLAIFSQSLIFPTQTENYFRSIARDLDFQIWPNVSHFLMMERPDDFNRTLRVFLSDRQVFLSAHR
jgi:pimeloyl-ACP methyl ester carboxylesterase